MQPIPDRILREIARHKDDWCFSQKDFMEIAGRNALEQAFFRLKKEGKIRRIGRGLYDVPRYSDLLKTDLSPTASQVAKAIARKHGWRILPTGAHAANMLNLSTQVPMKIVYQSDGPTKAVEFGNRTLYFKRTAPKDMAPNEFSGIVINALKYLGKAHVTPEIMAKLKRRFDEGQKKQLLEDARFSTDWIFEVVRKICCEGASDE
ncbi:MAG: type IV toxin-antitoxin system AbiEi family antitoxin domain-containing protein [Pontiellaceae bacterium]|nr:type IV toxin-antitoxin system AbiEi family antitoxin domain-containing protein [Pontiellaceae bacterium]